MMNLLNLPPCARCGHAYAAHYNVRETHGAKKPCHHLGKHDMRCQCRDYAHKLTASKGK